MKYFFWTSIFYTVFWANKWFFLYNIWGPQDKISKILDGSVWYVKGSALKIRFQKYITLINVFIFIELWPKLKKTWFWFSGHKSVNFKYFQKKREKTLHILQSYTFLVYEAQLSSNQKCHPPHFSWGFILPKGGLSELYIFRFDPPPPGNQEGGGGKNMNFKFIIYPWGL